MAGAGAPDQDRGDDGAGGTPAAVAADVVPTGWEWFWANVSPKADQSGPANLHKALLALESEGAPAPRLQSLQDIAARHGRTILAATVGTDVSPALVVALISVESSGQAGAQSTKGAQGLMQLIPDTASRFGVEDASDRDQNIKGGVAYLAWLMDTFENDPILALAGYNAGENAVKQSGGVPPFPETRAYVPKV
ncbi:MAG TPA: lytic transglycosylase domain-containing protein, partial [Aliiroseovarius sp.]|nr:lytic transglycosylase domain-containing protein [Aliiroseovarius sp.]